MLSVNELNEIEFIKAQNVRLIEQNRQLQKELEPFKDDYFKGLDNKTIAELAKKSIRITAENRRLENCLQEIKGIVSKIINGYLSFEEYYQLKQILDLITKAEEE